MKQDFAERWNAHAGVLKAYPTRGARTAALERCWGEAKQRSVVSVKTSVAETLLF